MRFGQRRVSAVTILVGVVMVLVPSLAWMQYQWLGQLSTAERERMQRTLRTAAAQFATEFDSEMSRTLVSLQVDGPTIRDQNWTAYAQRYSAWANSVGEPRLVRDVWLVDTKPGTALPALDSGSSAFATEGRFGPTSPIKADQLRLRKWNTQALAFEDVAAWPDDLNALRDGLATRFLGLQIPRPGPREAAGSHREATVSLTLGDDNTLISPATLFDMPADHKGTPKISILGFTIVRLDPVVIRDSVLSTLTNRHFHGNDSEVDYRVVIVTKNDPQTVVWESEPGIASMVTASPDVTQGFMGPRPEMFVFARNLRGETVSIPPPPPAPSPGSRSENIVVSMIEKETGGRGGPGGRVITRSGQFPGFETRWVLMAKHRSGSLEAAVAGVRTRNLIVSSSILMLLTVVIGLIAVSARRAQELARQQMEFVAAVSHELRTPVSVIGAAAGNLADGVVGDPQRVRKYGETIQGEARRLGETVERVLQLAGIAAGRAAAAQTPISPADLVHESINACRLEIESAGFNVEVAIADGLPNVVGDVTALKSALQNVISNAVKYGGDARWIRVTASLEPPRPGLAVTVDLGRGHRRGRSLFVSVEDRGRGIDADDRKHIFEPFYRGRDAVAQQIQGSGLGLNLVMRIVAAHGGHVMVNSEPGKGSTFTLALPAPHDHPATHSSSLATLTARTGD
ncbi:MAG TPA: HAMP domain-containing sensor histidine kinase [Vicinamibacterales bacterium]|nr:HAMP domain-containing sensor histidine kinase [Vicinamibacterales bacterium]